MVADPRQLAVTFDLGEAKRAGLEQGASVAVKPLSQPDAALEAYDVDALVYPTWNNPPRLVGDLTSPHGNNSPILSPPTGFPAVTVPMGFVWGDRLPAGLQIYGDAWSEAVLIRIAYAYEQATMHRRPPRTAPPLR